MSRASPSFTEIPPPYSAWLTLSNDPDNTTPSAWRELHEVIWEDLEIPFADSVFLRSFNDALPDQVSVESMPECATEHPVDTLHTWGDYTNSKAVAFSRDELPECARLMESVGLRPRIWVDHSYSLGNLLHRSDLGGQSEIVDASGHHYENVVYSLDHIVDAGIRYVWDGDLCGCSLPVDGPLKRMTYFRDRQGSRRGRVLGVIDRLCGSQLRRLQWALFDYDESLMTVPHRRRFADGREMHCFRRFGSWQLADISGFGELLSTQQLDRLVEDGGVRILYTHLGKRRADLMAAPRHIPEPTLRALEALATRHRSGQIMISSTSRLLDYLVLRRSARLSNELVDFRADGLRFETLAPSDLAGQVFGLRGVSARASVVCESEPIAHELEEMRPGQLLLRL